MLSPLPNRTASRATCAAAGLAALLLSACGGSPNSCAISGDCSKGLVCQAGACVAASQCGPGVLSCSDTSQCGSAKICQQGCCTAVQGCATSADCAAPALPHCDASNSCVKCASDVQCSAGRLCTLDGRCESGCATNADCKTAGRPICIAGGFCGQCKVSGDCTDPGKPVCAGGTCSGCASSADCSGANPVCNPSSKACVPCLDAQNVSGRNPACGDPAKPACVNQACAVCAPSADDAASGANAACPPASPVCDATSKCVACVNSGQCPAGSSCDGGACKAPVLANFATATPTVLLGGTATLTATLDVNASVATDVAVSVVSGGGALAASKITIAVGSNTGSVVYTAPAVAGTATVKASLAGVDKTVGLAISSSALALDSLLPAMLFVQAGSTATLTAALSAQATTSTSVGLSSDAAGTATVPASVNIAPGSSSAAVTVAGVAVHATAANVKASYNGVDKVAAVTVFALDLTSLTPAATTATAGSGVTTTLGFSPPPGQATVHVSVDAGTVNGGGTSADLAIAANATSTTFTVGMPASGTVNVTAAANGTTKAASIAVSTTGAPPTVMVIRVDGGGAALAGTSSAVTLEEHKLTTDAALRTIAMPIAVTAAGNTALTLTGNSGTEGGLSRSGDGKYVLLAGYGIAPGTTSPNQTASSATPRVIGRVDNAGNVDTTTRITTLFSGTAAASAAIRGATSTNGTDLWATGSTSGVVYTTLGGATAVALNSAVPTNNRHAHVFGGQLYVSSTTGAFQGISTVGTGAPTSGLPAITLLPGFPTAGATTISLGSFGLLDLDATPGPEVAYVAQEVVPGAADTLNVEKWTLASGTWTKSAIFAPRFPAGGGAGGAIGLAAFLHGASVRIVATTFESASATPNRLVTFIDDGSANPAVTVLATAPANSAFRGVALSPTP